MKYRFVNKRIIKLFYGYCLFWPIAFFALCFPPFLFASHEGKLAISIIYIICVISLYILTYMRLRMYFGVYYFDSNGVYFKKNKKTFFYSKNDILIVTIRDDRRVSPFDSKGSPSFTIRKKGEKNTMPIRLKDEYVMRKIIEEYECKRDPNNYKFKWE